ncbi:small nuclear ribonucleoprotein 35kDa (U11 U12), partial [Rhizopus stolonifer]
RPPRHLTSDPQCTLFIGRLSFDTTESTLRSHFEKYGEITQVHIIKNNVTGLSQGYGFVTFTRERYAKDAYHYANKSVLDSHVILVDFERSRTMKGWIPRRLGGGYGGKKESGQLRFGGRDRPFRETDRVSRDQKRSDHWRYTKRSISPSSAELSYKRQRHDSSRSRDHRRTSSRDHKRSR